MGTTAYPGAVDDFAGSSPTNLADADSTGRTHSERHDDMEAAMEAVQAKIVGADWTSYTPTLTGFTPGNGTATGAYTLTGELCTFWAKFVFGSTSAAATAAPKLSLPFTASADSNSWPIGGYFHDVSVNIFVSYTYISAGASVATFSRHMTDQVQLCSTTLPFTWAVNDVINCYGTYKIA